MSIYLGTAEIDSLKLGTADVSRVMLGNAEVWSAVDPDAADYFARIVAAGSSISVDNKAAVDAFVKGCKADGIWSAIKASCLLAGPDDLTGALVPLVGAAPTNVGGGFVSGDHNRTTGLIGNGSSKRLDSNRNNNTDPLNSQHLAAWVTVDDSATSGTPAIIGCGLSTNASQIAYSTASGTYFVRSRSSTALTGLPKTTGVGFQGIARASSSDITYIIGGNTSSPSLNSVAALNSTIKVFGRDATPYWNGRISFYSIGENLNLALLEARLATYMSSLT
jgi:hypothetical protein